MASFYPRLGVTQTIAAGTTTAVTITNAFGSQTTAIRIAAVAAVRFAIGNGITTVAATDPLLPAANIDRLAVTPGQKITALADSVTTVLFVTELA